jgi:hypothetical protein
MKLVWLRTGDEISIDPIREDICRFYIEECDRLDQNRFLPRSGLPSVDLRGSITQHLNNLKPCLTKINFVEFDFFNDPFDQQQLNRLHERWVKLHIKHPNIGVLLDKISPGRSDDLEKVNTLIHKIEESFGPMVAENKDFQYIDNNFGLEILSWDHANVRIWYKGLGRPTFSKWLFYDNNAVDADTNDFLEFSGILKMNLMRPHSIQMPAEYVEWCRHHNTTAAGRYLNVGNFSHIEENLTEYRHLFVRNFSEADNPMRLAI